VSLDHDLIVRGALVVRAGEVKRADVAVSDGVIAAVGVVDADAREEVDGTGLHLFPGGIDPHVHFNEPGRTDWEGFGSGSRALAAGGFTTFIEMPLNSVPTTVDGESFDRKLAAARGSAYVDFGLWGGLVPASVDRLEELHERGVAGFKAFMCDSGIEEFPRIDDTSLWRGMARIAELRSILLVHAENAEIVASLGAKARAAGRTGVRDFLASRPVVAEHEAIKRAIFFAGETGCALHVVHVSTGKGVRLVEEARRGGVDVTCETCPHYLVFSEDDLEGLGVAAKCAPPLRPAADRDELWELLADGTLGMVTSDHSPSPPELKGGDFLSAWGGIAGCQTTLQLLLEHGHARRGVDLQRVAAATSAGAAARFRLAGKHGLEPGSDADLTLVDVGETWALSAEELLYRHVLSPYVGLPVRGRIVRTIVRGRTVFAGGRVVAGGPDGQFVRPER
jgi:allantoinase